MMIAADNILLGFVTAAACLAIVLMGRAQGQRMKLIWGGLGVAAAITVLALLADKLMGTA